MRPRDSLSTYDITRATSRSTFDRLECFRQSMRRVKSNAEIPPSCSSETSVTRPLNARFRKKRVLRWRQFGCQFIETSAKMAQNVERLSSHAVCISQVFMNLVRSLRQKCSAHPGPPEPAKKGKKPTSKWNLEFGVKPLGW